MRKVSRLKFRPSLRQTYRTNAQRFLAFGDPEHHAKLLADPNVHERVKQGLRDHIAWAKAAAVPAKPRAPRLDAPHKPLEREIQKSIIEALRLHPRVLKVVRFNSGGSMHRDAQGRDHLVMFSSEPVPDLYVLLKGGFAWLEVKRPPWSRPTDAREERQARFLEAVREARGIGCFVRSVDEAIAAIS